MASEQEKRSEVPSKNGSSPQLIFIKHTLDNKVRGKWSRHGSWMIGESLGMQKRGG
jgi:hypothetical protein